MPEHQPPAPLVLEKEILDRFVAVYFKEKGKYLSLLENHGSPLWVLDTSVLKAKALRFSQAFNAYFDKTSYYFAMKSNNRPEVSATLLESGFGLDVSSGIELRTALNLNAGDIIFSGPGKTHEELNLALQHRDRVTLLLTALANWTGFPPWYPGRTRFLPSGWASALPPTQRACGGNSASLWTCCLNSGKK